MIRPPERGAERDAAIEAMLPHVPFDGWTRRALARGLADIGAPADEADLLFPGGAVALVEAFCDLADRQMTEGVATLDLTGDLTGPGAAKGSTARVHGAHGGCDLARRRRPFGRFFLVQQARVAGRGLRRDAAVLAARLGVGGR